jgi:hypothetical protein
MFHRQLLKFGTQKTGIHGFGSSSSTVKALNKPVKPGEAPKRGLMTLAEIVALADENKKKRVRHRTTSAFRGYR